MSQHCSAHKKCSEWLILHILSCNIPSMKQFFPRLSKISAMTQQLSTSCVLSMFPGIPFNYNLYNCGHLEMAWKINDESLSLELFQLLSCTRLKKYIVLNRMIFLPWNYIQCIHMNGNLWLHSAVNCRASSFKLNFARKLF